MRATVGVTLFTDGVAPGAVQGTGVLFVPVHVQDHGPEPVTALAFPTVQRRLVAGVVDVGTPAAAPQTPAVVATAVTLKGTENATALGCSGRTWATNDVPTDDRAQLNVAELVVQPD